MSDHPLLRETRGGVREMLTAARTDGPGDADASKRRVLAALAAMETAPASTTVHPHDLARSSRRPLVAAAGIAFIAAVAALSTFSASTEPSAAPGFPVARLAASPASAEPTSEPKTTKEEAPIPSLDVRSLPSAAKAASSATTPVAASSAPPTAPARTASADQGHVPTADKPTEGAGSPGELAAVEHARRQLAAGHANEALGEIAVYRATFVRARFAEEIDALEVEALAAAGARDDARSKAAAFSARYPASPYARRVRSVLTSLDEPRTP